MATLVSTGGNFNGRNGQQAKSSAHNCTRLTLRNGLLSLAFFLFLTSFLSFNIFLRYLHKAESSMMGSGNSNSSSNSSHYKYYSDWMASNLRADFLAGIPSSLSMSSIADTVTNADTVTGGAVRGTPTGKEAPGEGANEAIATTEAPPKEAPRATAETGTIASTDSDAGAIPGSDAGGGATGAAPPVEERDGGCAPFGQGSFFRTDAATTYKESAALPRWMKEYFDWHREQTASLNECNYQDRKFIVLRCSDQERKCGGIADRLKSLPVFVAIGAYTKRIFLIRWDRPTKLEEFLRPNEINWSVPDWLRDKLVPPAGDETLTPPSAAWITSGKHLKRYIKNDSLQFIEALLQDFYGGSSLYYWLDSNLDKDKEYDEEVAKKFNDMAGWSDYEKISRDLWFSVFEAAPPIAKLVAEKMESAGLLPNRFVTSQYRAFYGIEHLKDSKGDEELVQKTENALNCASMLQPGDPLFFASDSHKAVKHARSKAVEHPERVIVTFDDDKEALHLDKKDQWKSGKVSDFYPTFVDLLIMAEARCMAHGVGGFGRFANILSRDPSCVVRHDSMRPRQIQKCDWTDTPKKEPPDQ